MLRREGWGVNRKRVRRLYRLDGLQLRMRVRRRKHIALHRGPAPAPRVRGNVGAWISCMMPWPTVARFRF
jgi:putative transposase